MLTMYLFRAGRFEVTQVQREIDLNRQALWIDLCNPSKQEREWVQEVYGLDLPTLDALMEIESSARFYQDEDGLHIYSYFVFETDNRLKNSSVAFILKEDRLFTLRNEDLVPFRLFRMRARNRPDLMESAISVLLNLLEAKAEQLADILEQLYADLEPLGESVTAETGMAQVVKRLTNTADINDKARLSIMDEQRALSFLLRTKTVGPEEIQHLRELLRDLESLMSHSAFLFDRVDFLMDAAMGAINIEQNNIIKIFSIAAVVFLPPTLVASIYGMNFKLMPELNWDFGYVFALLVMILSGIAPYWYFKKRGWL